MSRRVVTGKLLLGINTMVLVAGCTVGPDYQRPELGLPPNWSQPQQQEIETVSAGLKDWWTVLNDSVLEGLIERATQANPDLKESLFRIEESRALRDFAGGRFAPKVDLAASYTRSRDSENNAHSVPGLG